MEVDNLWGTTGRKIGVRFAHLLINEGSFR
jgi:hypothetical protein